MLAALALSVVLAPQEPPARPNVVLVMADDLGWGDVRFNVPTARAETPRLDALAADAVVFDRFYAQSPVCSPTRGSALTGRHPFRYGIVTANSGHLPAAEVTLAELLREAGYRTGHFGKWHLGTLTADVVDSNRGGPRGAQHLALPTEHGFDVFFATEAKVPTFDPMLRPPDGEREDARWSSKRNGWLPLEEGEPREPYGTRYWTPEGEVEADTLRGDDSALVVDRAIAFVEEAVKDERPFCAVVWLHAPHLPVVAADEDRARYPGASPYEASYLGCVTALDRAVGRLADALRRLGVERDTLFAFTSDNGPEGGDKAPGSAGPFRGRKRSLYEGGVRVPGFVRWPARFAEPKRLTRLAGCTSDYLPTVAAAAGLRVEGTLDGVDLLPLIEADAPRPRGLGFVTRNMATWHDGATKLVGRREGKRGEEGSWRWELYDLDADRAERHDLAEQHPERVAELRARLDAWRQEVHGG